MQHQAFVYPQRIRRPLQKLVDQAKENIDVTYFRNPQQKVRAIKHFIFTKVLQTCLDFLRSQVQYLIHNTLDECK
jgi:hypothetical protein